MSDRKFRIRVDALGIDCVLTEDELDPDGEMGDDPEAYVRWHAMKYTSVAKWAEDWNILADPHEEEIEVTEVARGE